MKQTYRETRRLIREDIAWRCRFENKRVSRLIALRLMFHPGVASVLLFRWQRFFDDHHLGVLGSICRCLNLALFTSVYSSGAQIAGGFLVVHAMANLVDDGVVIGPRCVFYAQNSVTRSPYLEPSAAPEGGAPMGDGGHAGDGVPAGSGVPVIENDVLFAIGACVHGNIRIGAHCKIGMNTLVDFSAAPNSTLVGVPARVIPQKAAAAG
jgi:serine O-acetyltransferase